MPTLSGPFSLFPDLDTITAQELSDLAKHHFEHHTVENHLANRILYPQTVATTKTELDLDFYILAIAIRKHPELFFDPSQNRVIIPESLVNSFPPLTRLISIMLIGLPLQTLTQIWQKDDSLHTLIGSAIPFSLVRSLNLPGEIKITIKQEVKTLIAGQLNLIPLQENQVKIQFDPSHSFDVLSGNLGLFVDLREGN